MKVLRYLLIILMIPTMGHTNPKLFSSDWPVWNLTDGMHKNGMLDSFNYRNTKYATCLRWFKAGNLDITFMTLYDFISIQPTKLPTVIIGVTDYSNGGDKIIARNSIKKPADLKGKKILLPSDTISLWLLHNYLMANALTVDDVEVVDQNETLAALQFKEDQSFAAVVGWNPIINKALSEDSYIAATSADFPKVIYDVIVAKKSLVDENSSLVDSFVSDFYKGIHDDDVIDKTAQGLSVTSKEYRTWLQDAYVFPSRAAANDQYNRLIHQSNKIANFLTTAPKSILSTQAASRFRPRKLDMNSLIKFGNNR